MRVLVVDCYGARHGHENREFDTLKRVIDVALQDAWAKLVEDISVDVRKGNSEELTGILYDKTTEFNQPHFIDSFNDLDCVVIAGPCNQPLPWSAKARPVQILLKMCVTYHKSTLLVGSGMQLLAHLAAVGKSTVRVCNGRGSGGPLSSMDSLPDRVVHTLKKGDYFLDQDTGNLWKKDKELGEWSQRGNVGLRYQRSNQRPNVPSAELGTVVCERVSKLLHHWSLKDVPDKFVASYHALWEVNSNAISIGKGLVELIKSQRGPQLIAYGPMLAMQFPTLDRYAATCKIVENFFVHVFDVIASGQRVELCQPSILVDSSAGQDVSALWQEQIANMDKRQAKDTQAINRSMAQAEGSVEQTQHGLSQAQGPRKLHQMSWDDLAADAERPGTAETGNRSKCTTPSKLKKSKFSMQIFTQRVKICIEHVFFLQLRFSRSEIRQMLHPGIAPPLEDKATKTVRVHNEKQKPFNKYEHYKALYEQPGLMAFLYKARIASEKMGREPQTTGNPLAAARLDKYVVKRKPTKAKPRTMIVAGPSPSRLFPNSIPNYVGATPILQGPGTILNRKDQKDKFIGGSWKPTTEKTTGIAWKEI